MEHLIILKERMKYLLKHQTHSIAIGIAVINHLLLDIWEKEIIDVVES